jgi:hypothetical protein
MRPVPDYHSRAFTLIGQAIFEWGLMEQSIVRQTWRARDPFGKSPFPVGGIEQGFFGRWNHWCHIHRATFEHEAELERFRGHVHSLSRIRDDLCHNVWTIFDLRDAPDGDFSLAAERRHFDWKKAFAKWAKKFASANPLKRPPPPTDQEIKRYDPRHLLELIANTRRAHASMKRRSKVLVHALRSSAPTIPKIPV